MNTQHTVRRTIRWDKTEAHKVATEFHRLRSISGTSMGNAFEQCQHVLMEDRWKTLASLQNYFYTNKLHISVDGEETSPTSQVPVISVCAHLEKTPVSLSVPDSEGRPAVHVSPGSTLEDAIANYVKQEMHTILEPVRIATKRIEKALNDQLAEIQKPGGAIRFFARSLEEEEQDLLGHRVIDAAAERLTNSGNGSEHPLKHTVGIVGLVGNQVSIIKNQFRGSKLYLRFADKGNNTQVVKTVRNMENVLVMSSKVSHSLTKTMANAGLVNKTTYFNSMTGLSDRLREIEASF